MASKTFTDRLRDIGAVVSVPLGKKLHSWGISPDFITMLGLGVVFIGAIFIGRGDWLVGLVLLLLALPLDHLDGAVARAGGEFRPVGSLLDSSMDRYADGFIMGGFAFYFAETDVLWLAAAAMVGLHGSLMVSYMRAKAESLHIDCKIGLFTRVERTIAIFATLMGGLLIGENAVGLGLVVLAVGTQFTAIQRFVYVAKQLNNKKDN